MKSGLAVLRKVIWAALFVAAAGVAVFYVQAARPLPDEKQPDGRHAAYLSVPRILRDMPSFGNTPLDEDRFVSEKLEGFGTLGRVPGALDKTDIEKITAERPVAAARLQALMAFDADNDGRLIDKELKHRLQEAFRTLDTDHDGKLTALDRALITNVNKAEDFRAACTLPAIETGEKIAFIGADDGGYLSGVALSGQNQTTSVARLEIIKGREKLYLILSAEDAVIWQLSGDVARVSKIVVIGPDDGQSPVIAAGVTGAPAGKISFYPRRPCMQETRLTMINKGDPLREIRWLLRRDPDASHVTLGPVYDAAVSAAEVALAAKQWQLPAPDGFDHQAWVAFMFQSQKSGIADLAGVNIVTRAKPESYVVLPGIAGIAQLIGSGAMESDALQLNKPEAALRPDYTGQGAWHLLNYRLWLLKDIPALPAELYNKEIVLARGVALPPGGDNLCIVSQETGLGVGKRKNGCAYLYYPQHTDSAAGACPYKGSDYFRQLLAGKYAGYGQSKEPLRKDKEALFGGTEGKDDLFSRGVNKKATFTGLGGDDYYFLPLAKGRYKVVEKAAPDEVNTLIFTDMQKKDSHQLYFFRSGQDLAISTRSRFSEPGVVLQGWYDVPEGQRKPVSCFAFLPGFDVISADEVDRLARTQNLDPPIIRAESGIVRPRPARRMFENLPAGTKLHYLAATGTPGRGAAPVGVEGSRYDQMIVNVASAEPVMLVLAAMEPVNWVIRKSEHSSIAGILLTGMPRSSVTGDISGVSLHNASGGFAPENILVHGRKPSAEVLKRLEKVTGIAAGDSTFDLQVMTDSFTVR